MRAIYLAALVAVLIGPASAQTIDCRAIGDTVTCREREGGGIPDYGAIMGAAENSSPSYQENERRQAAAREMRARAAASREAVAATQRADKLRREVGALLAEAKCPEAEAVALKGGDIELAGKAREYCASK